MFFFLYMKELLLHFKVLCVVFVSIFPQGLFFLNDVDIFINTCMTYVDLDDKLYMSNSEGLQ